MTGAVRLDAIQLERRQDEATQTLDASQGHERTPSRFTATRPLDHRRPRRAAELGYQLLQAQGGCAQPIRRQVIEVETLKSRPTR